MRTITVRCKCGELIRVNEQSASDRLKCQRCGRSGELRSRHRTIPTGVHSASGSRHRREDSVRTSRPVVIWHRIIHWSEPRIALAVDTIAGLIPTTLLPGIFPARRAKIHTSHRAVRPRSTVSPVVSLLTILVWAYLAVACLIALVLWEFGDRWWPATVLLFIGRWIFLIPLALLAPAAVLLRRSLLLPLALTALVVIGPVMGYQASLRGFLPAGQGFHFRVVTFNVDGGDDVAGILPVLLTQWEPDVVAFQECGDSLIQAVAHVDGWYHHNVRALCLLSRYPIVAANVMNREALERVHENETAGIGGSGDVASYVIGTPRGPVDFTNLHLETPRKGLEGILGVFSARRLRENTRLRDIESDLARRWVERGHAPTLVAGDFNTPVESRIFQQHWGDLTDAFSSAGFGLGMTRYNGWIRVRIDHVLSGPAWHANRVTVGPDYGSDHRPVIVDLTLGTRR